MRVFIKKEDATLRSHSFWMAIYLIAAGYEPASAQDAEPNMLDRCQTAPQTDNQAPQNDQTGKSTSRSLTETLKPCDGCPETTGNWRPGDRSAGAPHRRDAGDQARPVAEAAAR